MRLQPNHNVQRQYNQAYSPKIGCPRNRPVFRLSDPIIIFFHQPFLFTNQIQENCRRYCLQSSVWNHHADSIAGSNKLKKLKKVLSCPGNLNDVGISTNTTLITTIFCCSKNCLDAVDSRTDNQDPPHHSNPRSTSKQEPPKHQPTNMDQPQITINSPAIAHQSRHPQSWFRNHSPNRSHIPQTQESGLDVERITSSSKPDPETDHPKPNTLDEDSGNGLESEDDQEDLSNETLGDLNLSALDDLESRFDTSQSPERQRLNNRSSRTRNTSPAVQAQPQLILITFNLTFHHIAPSVAYSSSQIRSCCQ
ncbi:hypothetical protein PCASD_25876 [Puccinia coronata f. sp. avenae]|uniref:Uncharacterized protein n=1 Tax=Puccinia coronata f. sp. avenae TaxID=200324 RepID=A0A2N5RUB8_9BASI|nr:hypothetical protein PCASD_25876 [Puccinia coronata f. sp. avenae]